MPISMLSCVTTLLLAPVTLLAPAPAPEQTPAGAAADAAGTAAAAQPRRALPEIVITRDNTRITRSCRVVIPSDMVIADADGNGVIHIAAPNIRVEFVEGSVLRGARVGEGDGQTPWDQLTGYGIRVEDVSGVTIAGAVVRGFKGGIIATNTDGLTVEDTDLADIYRARLGSTTEREDSSNWISPHRNDDNRWLTNYGAALYIEDAENVTVRRTVVRRSQNGIILDAVNNSRVYDNDASFLSGWGLALWRSSNNLISRNAFDFCVRGHVEGVYNRGQDSAGILFFEQCNENIVVENSTTHGGDGFFGFAGLDALGDAEYAVNDYDRTRVGVNDNVFVYNDMSYAPAHGWEMTFSFGNVVANNRLVGNSICGVWGGFSQETDIIDNLFETNGGMPYGLERGGVNIEHGRDLLIAHNRFINNRVGVHLWHDDPGAIATIGWGRANYTDNALDNNLVISNLFAVNDDPKNFHRLGDQEQFAFVQLRGTPDRVRNTVIAGNDLRIETDRGADLLTENGIQALDALTDAQRAAYAQRLDAARQRAGDAAAAAIGEQRPVTIENGIAVSARNNLSGRENIIVDEWGPWNHEGAAVRTASTSSGRHAYDVFTADGSPGQIEITALSEGVKVSHEDMGTGRARYTIELAGPGVGQYEAVVQNPAGEPIRLAGSLMKLGWQARFWAWQNNPLENLEAWREEARTVEPVIIDGIAYPYGFGGPEVLGDVTDGFGMIATTNADLTPGTWRISTRSDDGVRVFINGDMLFERWDIHGPTPDQATFKATDEPVEIIIEHFENDGYAWLEVELERVGD